MNNKESAKNQAGDCPNDLALAQMGRREDTEIKESVPAPSVASSALFSSVLKTSPELQEFEASKDQQSLHTGSKESDFRSQRKPTNQPPRDCRTDDENSQEANQSDCSLGQGLSLEPNSRSASQEVGSASVSQQHEENQKPYCHGHLNSISGSGQENGSALNQNEYQKDGVPLAESANPMYQQYPLTHIGLIDVSPYPNPHNEKTKIALVGGYLRRVPLSHPEPESASPAPCQKEQRQEYRTLDGAVSYGVSEEENDLAHRHGGAEAPIWERDPELKRAIEETHDAVFGAAPCSAPVFSSKVIGNEYTFERRVEVNDGYSEKTFLTPNQSSNDLPPKRANQTQYPD